MIPPAIDGTGTKSALITGGAGFIGSHLVDQLLEEGWQVTVLDNFDPFYDPAIKRANILPHLKNHAYRLIEVDICDYEALKTVLAGEYDVIVHLAAKAGVRRSITDPLGVQRTNVYGVQNLLELAKLWGVPKFVFASSSSVYGANPNVPWSESDHVLMPISPYASSKVSGELLGHVYSHLHDIRFIALRFFTVYGPRQRPDMVIHKFARLMLEGKPIPIFGDGNTRRDYTFVGDIVQGIRAAMNYDRKGYDVMNLGNSETVGLSRLVDLLGEAFSCVPEKKYLAEQPGDVPQTWAHIDRARSLLGYEPSTRIHDGLRIFRMWLNETYADHDPNVLA